MSYFKRIILLLAFTSAVFGQEQVHIDLNLITKSLPFGLTKLKPVNYPKISIALSGGGSRAISQIGILKALEKNDVQIDNLVGTSMGSVIGGMYASGYCLSEIDSILLSKDWQEFVSINETNRNDLFVDKKITEDRAIFSIRFDGLNPIIPTSLNTGQKVLNFLNQIFINAPLSSIDNFNELLFPFRAVATDLVSGNTVVLDSGSISRSLRASSSVSFLLPPVKIDSLLLADGGLVANVPVQVARQTNSDIIIALDATSPLHSNDNLNLPWIIADQVISIPITILTKQQLEAADVIIQPYLGKKSNTDFTDLDKIIDLGYKAVLPHLKKIEELRKNNYINKSDSYEFYFHNISGAPNNPLAAEILSYISEQDSVSDKEIEFYLAAEFQKGIYKDISADVTFNGNEWILNTSTIFNPTISSINLVGDADTGLVSFEKHFRKLIGKPYSGNQVVKTAIEFLREYKKAGYSLTTIDNIYFDEVNGILQVTLWNGNIDEIRLQGNNKTNPTVILRELPFESGDKLMYSKLEEGLENLRITGLFEEVDIYVEKENNRNIIIIKVVEKISEVLRFGLKIDNEYFTQFLFDLREENLFGSGAEVGFSFFSGPRNRDITLEQKSSRIFDTYLTYNLKFFYSSLDISSYTEIVSPNGRRFAREKSGEYKQRIYGSSIALGAQVRKFGNLYGEFAYHRNQIDNMLNQPESEYLINLATLKFGLKIDSQNKYPYPTAGFLVNSYYETAQDIFNADLSFSKIYFDYTHYFTFNSLHTFKVHSLIGVGDETLPLSQQFSFGGQDSFLGYREYGFRGRQIFISSLEYRIKLPFQIFFDTYLKARYDLGSIWKNSEKIKFKTFRHGVGATLSFDTPVGPADFTIARSFLLKEALPKSFISRGETIFYFNIGFYY